MYRAIRVASFGGVEQLKIEKVAQALQPLSSNQVVINVHACAVNPVETYIRTGTHTFKPALPYTPGNDGSGIVAHVGDQVKHLSPGDRVYISKSLTGTYAQQTLCEQEHVHRLPDSISFHQGASIGTAYLTAYRALIQRTQAQPNETVLVHGASGGVGLAAVQLGRMYGMKVFGTASTEKGQALVKEQGALYVGDHSREGYLEELVAQTEGRGMDVILEMLANVNLAKDLQLLAKNGRIGVIGNRGTIEINPRDTMNTEGDIRGVYLPNATPQQLNEAHAALFGGFETGALNPIVGHVLPLSQASKAHELVMQSGACGKIILDCETL